MTRLRVDCSFPVILSFENHCSVEQQRVMAKHLVEILGGKLLIPTGVSMTHIRFMYKVFLRFAVHQGSSRIGDAVAFARTTQRLRDCKGKVKVKYIMFELTDDVTFTSLTSLQNKKLREGVDETQEVDDDFSDEELNGADEISEAIDDEDREEADVGELR